MMRINDLPEAYLQDVLEDIFSGRSTSLGSKLYKIKASKKGSGKRGGYRNIFFWKKEKLIVFIYLFPKNVRDNISSKEFREFKILADELDHLSAEELKTILNNGDLTEVDYYD